MTLLLAGATAQAVEITGTYSNMVHHEQEDDYIGVRVEILRSNDGDAAGYYALVQFAEGVLMKPELVTARVKGSEVQFKAHHLGGMAVAFQGVASDDALRGKFSGLGDDMLMLARIAAVAKKPTSPDALKQLEEKTEACMKKGFYATSTVSECLDSEYQSLDKLLNVTYKTLRGRLSEKGKVDLKMSQRAWITLRDLDFTMIDSALSGEGFGGTMWGPITMELKNGVIRSRIETLRDIANNWQ